MLTRKLLAGHFVPTDRLFAIAMFIAAVLGTQPAFAATVAYDMVGSASQNLLSHTNPYENAFSSAGDGFQKYQRGVSPTIPFAVLDDSLSIFPADSLGIIGEGNTDVFFGVTDTVNGDNSGPVSATWVFDVAGAGPLQLSIDMGAMGDFEANDVFTWTYSFDGGAAETAFASTVDEDGAHTYTLEGGASFTLSDPMLVNGTVLSNELATFTAGLNGSGSELTITLTASTDGGSEAFAFQNLVLETADPRIAYDMVGSASQNLLSHTNPYENAFSSAGDGFQKYQRGVSPTIPFAVLDDSLSIFPADSLGIIGEGNTDVFFGVTDTVNGDNSGPVSATWVFDVAGAGPLQLSIDMGAMGDFEANDVFTWTYSFDGGAAETAFASTVDEDGAHTYTLEGGASFTLSDPMLVNGTVLSNELATFTAGLNGSGSELTITLTASTDGGSEAFAFQNLVLAVGSEPPPPPELEIWEIQGDGPATPYDGQVVISRDNVVTALAADGFFMQTPPDRSDGNVDTSDGVFVYTGAAPAVAVGDRVDVTGTPKEFFGLTEIEPGEVTVVGSSALPAAVVFDFAVPSPDPMTPSCAIEFECYEGMLIEIAGGVVTGPNQRFNSDPSAEVYITAAPDRTFREPGIEYPGIAGLPEWDGNPEVFELDPNRLGLDNAVIPAGSRFDATGVLGYEFGGYELWPTTLSVTPAPLPVAVREVGANEMTVGALNLFRLFDDIDDPDIDVIDPVTGEVLKTTGETVVATDEYQRRLDKLSAYIRGPLGAPDILAVSEVESLKVLQDLGDRIQSDEPAIAYTAILEEGNDVGGIDVGFLVRDSVTVDAVNQLGRFERLSFDGSLLNDRPPLLVEARHIADGSDFPVAVIAIHSRSLGGIDGSDGERVRQKRYEQAQFVASVAQALQEEDPDINLVVAGDFNAYEFSDGYVDVTGIMQGAFDPADNLVCRDDANSCESPVDPPLVNAVKLLPAGERYSFIFEGSAQVLDHALTSSGLDELVRDFAYARGNADAAVDLVNDGTTPLRASDHDGFVLYLAKDSDGDGVTDDADLCPATMIPESVPTVRLLPNNFALVDDDRVFDTAVINAKEPKVEFDIFDTAGCSCEQIIVEQELGNGHSKFGCSIGEMEEWVELHGLP